MTYLNINLIFSNIEVPGTIDRSLSAGAWVMLFVIFTIFLFFIAGIVITYTRIGDNLSIRNGAEASSKLEERKTKWAMIFVSFNPLLNTKKIVTVKQGGDQTLTVLNGVRVLSMAWVIVGHAFVFPMSGAVVNQTNIANMFE